jgi:hypothetical protein
MADNLSCLSACTIQSNGQVQAMSSAATPPAPPKFMLLEYTYVKVVGHTLLPQPVGMMPATDRLSILQLPE